MREHDVTALTARELEQARRELPASLALTRPGSPARVPILAHLTAIDAELASSAAPGVSSRVGRRVPWSRRGWVAGAGAATSPPTLA